MIKVFRNFVDESEKNNILVNYWSGLDDSYIHKANDVLNVIWFS